ncbi:uncharacterized protein TrAFT101_001596 [Trichoderma asperellum]|uniref:Dihydroneopterin aldolase/epimerase domain-containing protein n=1 Tax=Trichoderma asperellum (strain ATCC 204424 / CBS 433.97 / NBRC 101777) TaxID=1042311 RepID=A0A2T3ZE09_TRIA4|nr:hypothetical protein M441DRAFT_66794 [Trichoderma asperellum CBS 433.97]PTB43035.1 hypothetical protein M441DRAFT_66794 [Trichoderma asperellum CBS 433.97]UKZ85750.1 hypothetical protein TrAFT101_001596 [Trichoderma asperellum]
MADLEPNWRVRFLAGQPPAKVRVRNLQTSIEGPSDAWNRKGKQQPLSVSASVMLKEAFDASSSADKVAGDTVHYGLLSKAILASLEGKGPQHPAKEKSADAASTSRFSSLRDVVNTIWEDLTNQDANGKTKVVDEEEEEEEQLVKSFLKASTIRCFELTAHLPKASLLGSGVSLTRIALFGRDGESRPQPRGMSLKIHDLRVPTLIGVNGNERKAKQVVVATIEIDKFNIDEDVFTMIEAETVEVMSQSSFETLEALANTLAFRLASYLHSSQAGSMNRKGWPIKIALEKPIAVVLADAACVQLSVISSEVLGGIQ